MSIKNNSSSDHHSTTLPEVREPFGHHLPAGARDAARRVISKLQNTYDDAGDVVYVEQRSSTVRILFAQNATVDWRLSEAALDGNEYEAYDMMAYATGRISLDLREE